MHAFPYINIRYDFDIFSRHFYYIFVAFRSVTFSLYFVSDIFVKVLQFSFLHSKIHSRNHTNIIVWHFRYISLLLFFLNHFRYISFRTLFMTVCDFYFTLQNTFHNSYQYNSVIFSLHFVTFSLHFVPDIFCDSFAFCIFTVKCTSAHFSIYKHSQRTRCACLLVLRHSVPWNCFGAADVFWTNLEIFS